MEEKKGLQSADPVEKTFKRFKVGEDDITIRPQGDKFTDEQLTQMEEMNLNRPLDFVNVVNSAGGSVMIVGEMVDSLGHKTVRETVEWALENSSGTSQAFDLGGVHVAYKGE